MTTHASKACCELPPAVSEDYKTKGSYSDLSKFSAYITGNHESKKAIMFIYDIFGFRSPTLQGADILSSQGYLVIMPDFFEGTPAEPEWMLKKEEGDNKEKFSKFLGRIQDPKPHLENLNTALTAAKQKFPTVESWGTIGYCWGGKIVALTSGPDSAWKASVATSPAFIDPEDAKKVTVPFAMLASKDESADNVKAFGEALTVPKHVETFGSQVHGWMSARADLKDKAVKQEYERGYEVATKFFQAHL